jgi:hypothetical protein
VAWREGARRGWEGRGGGEGQRGGEGEREREREERERGDGLVVPCVAEERGREVRDW